MSWLPDFQLNAGTTFYDVNGASPWNADGNSNHTYFIGLQATIPLWFVFDQRVGISAAAQDQAAAQANLQSISNQSQLALQSAFETYQASEQKIRNFEEHILPLTDQSLNLAIINYGAGKVDFQTLADAATARRTTRQTYLTTLMNYLIAYSNIGLLIGEDL
jgi:outer membrane protein TolC